MAKKVKEKSNKEQKSVAIRTEAKALLAKKKIVKKAASKKKVAKKLKSKKKVTSKKIAPKVKLAKKAAPKAKVAVKKAAPKKKVAARRGFSGKSQDTDEVVFAPKGLGARSGGQSGDLQGLSNKESADSESVDELLEEGNAFEAEVVKGVEDVPDADEGEVRTHEVPEDDVPEEYLEKDQ
jgi:hypothetical protein